MKTKNIKNPEDNTIAGIFEKNIKQSIKKRESLLPLYVKGFSDAHREYTKYIEQMFKTMKANEEKYFGKPDEEIMKICEKYVNASFKSYLSQIDASKEILKSYLEIHLSFMKSWNDHLKKIAED